MRVIRRGKLRWFGHEEQMGECGGVGRVREVIAEGRAGRGYNGCYSSSNSSRMNLECISVKMREGRLRWLGHVAQMCEGGGVRRVETAVVAGRAGTGRPKKAYDETIESDLWILDLNREAAKN